MFGSPTLTSVSKQITALAAQVTAIAAGMQTQFAAVSAQQTAQAAQLAALLTQQGVQNTLVSSILADAQAIIKLVTPVPSKATKITLGLPKITKKGIVMANFELKNDNIASIAIQTADAGGAVEPYPAGDTFSAVSSNPASLGAAIAVAGGVASLVLTPLVQQSPGLTVTVSDTSGLPPVVLTVDIVDDLSDTTILLNTVGAVTTTQPIPAAPGP